MKDNTKDNLEFAVGVEASYNFLINLLCLTA